MLGVAARGVVESTRRFVVEYAREWQPTDERSAARLSEALGRLSASINSHDVTLLEKPGGLCPFCNMASALLRREQLARDFSLHVSDLLHDEREGLKAMLRADADADAAEQVLTYPVIYIRGGRLAGGYTELQRLADGADGLGRALSRERAPFVPPDHASLLATLPSRSARPKLCYQAGGGPWLTFQTRLFGNVLRLVALLQVALLSAALALHSSSPRGAALLLGLLGLDALLFVVVGPSPLSPLGALATALVWRRRGSVVSAVPYKVTFGLYALGCLANLACAFAPAEERASGEGDGSRCALPHGAGLTTTLLINSSALAVFRF